MSLDANGGDCSGNPCRVLLLAGIALAFGIAIPCRSATAAPGGEAAPQALWWRDDSGAPRTQVGVVYFPDVLASILGERRENPPSPLAEAVRQRAPVVVMWGFPDEQAAAWPRPFGMAIVEPGGDSAGMRVEPLWIRQDAEVFKGLDPRVEFPTVGAVAAFEPKAFVRGRLVVLYSGESRLGMRAQRWGTIDWGAPRLAR